jgi:hypothetical protein
MTEQKSGGAVRNMSFALTAPQIIERSKTVTRRVGWKFLKEGDLLQPIRKGQGLKKGESPEKLGGPIRIVSVRRERLDAITPNDVIREGFQRGDVAWFIDMFCATHTIPDTRVGPPKGRKYRQPFPMLPVDEVTRIEFEYMEDAQ